MTTATAPLSRGRVISTVWLMSVLMSKVLRMSPVLRRCTRFRTNLLRLPPSPSPLSKRQLTVRLMSVMTLSPALMTRWPGFGQTF
ncbi:hypothetical protein BC829DRAFT_38274 [Chytridium lagenaria]|nr:hypothetical protein BC829DRAFT_38274 [Chytridium lagenaria]